MSAGPVDAPPATTAAAPLLDDDWDRPPRREARTGDAPILSVDGWDGPLDWLLDLARSRRIDLAKLPIADLIEAFVVALQTALVHSGPAVVPLGTLGDWVVMAATLTLLRSRLMLPRDDAEARTARAEAEALRRQMLDRAATAAAADWLDRRDQLGRDVFGRGQPEVAGTSTGRVGDITGLLRACLVVLQLPWDAESVYRQPPAPPWTIAQAVARIRQLLPRGSGGMELGVFLPGVPMDVPDRDRRCRGAVAATFCGGLELARDQMLTLDQREPWAAVKVSAADV